MLIRIMFRAIFFYFVIIFSYKLMGKRELGELSLIDFVISTVLSQMIAISIENYKDPLIYTLVPLILLVLLQILLAIITLKNKKIRNFIDGKESLIINNGILNIKEMIKQRYSLDDLLTQLRDKNIRSIEEVEYAILETGGKLSVFKKNDKDKKTFPLPLIVDGEIELDNLKYINKDEKWLKNILLEKKTSLNEVFYSFLKGNDVFIIKKN
ncbi:MAG: DUF421 domain-containing protein [Bacilli bacterium]|nr:DUF421 domain-containing protein [Bacilli bacterium]